MAKVTTSLLTGDTMGAETDYRTAMPVNMTGIIREIFGVTGYMIQTPGLLKFGDSIGIDRGAVWNERQGNQYRVSAGRFIKVNSGGDFEDLGEISGLDTVTLPYSFNTQGIVADGRFWLYDDVNGLVEVIDPELGNPIDSVWVDSYYFFTDGEYLFHTDITDETSISPLKFATAEFSPDLTFGVEKTVDNKVMAFGRYSIEYFKNIASQNFAFTRISARAIKLGIVGTHCKAEMLNSWFVMGGRKEEDVGIHKIGVGSVSKISSREIDKIISKYRESELSLSVLETRADDDYHYLIVHLPGETLIYNAEVAALSGKNAGWSILTSDVSGNDTWRAKHGVHDPRLSKWIYGDKIEGTICSLDNTIATHYGKTVESILYTKFIYLDGLSIDSMDIQIVPGHTPFLDAGIFVSLTYDGVAYSTEFTVNYGEPSQYNNRFIIYAMGHVDGYVGIKLRMASKSRMAFSRITLDVG